MGIDEPDLPDRTRRDPRRWLFGLIPALAVVIAFWPAMSGSFVNWDDPINLLRNPQFRTLDAARVRWALGTFHGGVYQPLAWLALLVQRTLFGLQPLGYHLTSLAVHVVSAVVLYRLTVRLNDRGRPAVAQPADWPCDLAAALVVSLYAAHPLRAEVVAWVSCQPYLWCGLMSLLSVDAYLRAHPTQGPTRRGWAILAWLLFLAALMFKAPAIGLPLVLLLLDLAPLGRLKRGEEGVRRAWLEKIPYFVLSVVFAGLAMAARRDFVESRGIELAAPSLLERGALAGWSAAHYLVETLVPTRLLAAEPPPLNPLASPMVLGAAAGVVIGTLVVVVTRHRGPGLAVAWLSYLVVLAPTSGLVSSSAQVTADRYAALPMMCLTVFAAELLGKGFARRTGVLLGGLVVGLALLVCLGLSRQQSAVWHDSQSLWKHAIAHADRPYALHFLGLGQALLEAGQYEASLDPLSRALQLDRSNGDARHSLGVALERLGRLAAAESYFVEGVQLRPDDPIAHASLGELWMRLGRPSAAEGEFREAVRLWPDNIDYRSNLASALLSQGRPAEAEPILRGLVAEDPTHINSQVLLVLVLAAEGRMAEAQALAARLEREHPGNGSLENVLRLMPSSPRNPPGSKVSDRD